MKCRTDKDISLLSAKRRLKPKRLIAPSCLALCLWFTPLAIIGADAEQNHIIPPKQKDPILNGVKASNEIPGVIRPEREAKLSARISSQVTHAVFREGTTFKKGEVLVAFDCRELEQELAAAKARKSEMRAELESARYLVKHGAGSRLENKIAFARAKRASAEEGLIQERIKNCVIKAPFDGSIATATIQPYEVTSYGQELMRIVSTRDLQIELRVPSNWVSWLSAGQRFNFKVEETGSTHKAYVERIGSTVDAVSQTIKLFAVFDKRIPTILPGMSGTAHFDHLALGLR